MSSTIEMPQQSEPIILGGWSPYQQPTSADLAVFREAVPEPLGRVYYTPRLVSTQRVAGENFRFKCTATEPPADVVWEATVQIFQPLNGRPHVTHITPAL